MSGVRMKCLNVTCQREASGFHGVRGFFCRTCIVNTDPFNLRCIFCDKTFTKYEIGAKIPKYCSRRCMHRFNYKRKMGGAVNAMS